MSDFLPCCLAETELETMPGWEGTLSETGRARGRRKLMTVTMTMMIKKRKERKREAGSSRH